MASTKLEHAMKMLVQVELSKSSAIGMPTTDLAASCGLMATSLKLFAKMLRMGSFNSAPKILNDDHQDKNLTVPPKMSRVELMDFCAKVNPNNFELLRRPFQRRDSSIVEHIKHMSLTGEKVERRE